jgi:putative hydrolase
MTNPSNWFDPEDFKRFMDEFLANQEGLDPEQLAQVAGLANNPEQLQQFIQQMKSALNNRGTATGVDWNLVREQAVKIVRVDAKAITESDRKAITEACSIANLWLDQATDFEALHSEPKLIGRELWVDEAMPLFKQLAGPIADRMSDALTRNLIENSPEELSAVIESAAGLMRSAGGAMFSMQLGQSLGKTASEVWGSGDLGIPLFQEARAAFVVQNISEQLSELDVMQAEVEIYLAVREMAHARLFKNARWLRDLVVNQIVQYSQDLSIDNDRIQALASELDPSQLEKWQDALQGKSLISEPTEAQSRALASIENTLALIEGWVEVVTASSCKLLPGMVAIEEYVRRRRATGGPAERTFGQLIGLELKPRRLREAANFWRVVSEQLSVTERDAIWRHPDLLPTGADIDDPAGYLARRKGSGPDDFDQALKDLLG